MSTLIVLLYILFVAAAIILTVVILLQEGKGGGFGDALGAAGQQAFGVKASGVQRFTMWVALAFLGSAVLIHILNNKRQSQPDIEGGGDLFEESAPGAGDTESGAVDHSSLLEGLTFELR
ncbi:MAG: preprotein translocase subunit SecG [Planctomycetota bacterium]|nr:preprotein translocase subunit SecG [Planctomycetota bacterium]